MKTLRKIKIYYKHPILGRFALIRNARVRVMNDTGSYFYSCNDIILINDEVIKTNGFAETVNNSRIFFGDLISQSKRLFQKKGSKLVVSCCWEKDNEQQQQKTSCCCQFGDNKCHRI